MQRGDAGNDVFTASSPSRLRRAMSLSSAAKAATALACRRCIASVHAQHLLIDLRLDVARDVQVVIVGGNLLQRHHARHAFHILVSVIPAVDALDVLGQQLVLGAAGLELASRRRG